MLKQTFVIQQQYMSFATMNTSKFPLASLFRGNIATTTQGLKFIGTCSNLISCLILLFFQKEDTTLSKVNSTV